MSQLGLTFVLGSVGAGAVARMFGDTKQHVKTLGDETNKLRDRLERTERALGSLKNRGLHAHGGAVSALTREYHRLGEQIRQTEARAVKFAAVSANRDTAVAKRQGLYGQGLEAMALGAPLAAAGKVAASYEDKLRDISITGEMTRSAEAQLGRAMRDAAVRFNQSADSVADGVAKLVAQGMRPELAEKYAGTLAKTSTATRADMGDLAGLVFTLETKFGIKGEKQMSDALNVLAKSGKLGQYELRDMVKGFPELGGAAASFGSKGMDGVKEMGAMMQLMRAGAGTTGEADTNMRNWFSHMSANSTQTHFEKVGIQYEKEKLKVMMEKRVSAIEASFMVFDDYLDKMVKSGRVEVRNKKGKVTEVTDVRRELDEVARIAAQEGLKGEELQARILAAVRRMGLGDVLQDIQATQAYLAWSTGKAKYAQDRKTLDGPETAGTIDRDYDKRVETATENWKKLKVASAELGITVGSIVLPAMIGVANWLNNAARFATDFANHNPKLTAGLVFLGQALIGLKMGFIVAGYAAAWYTSVKATVILAGMRLAPVFGVLKTGALWLGRVLMGLAGVTVAAFALMGAAIYLWATGWRDIVGGAKALWQDLSQFIGSQVTRWRALGSALIDGLIGGLKARWESLKATIGELATSVKGWFAKPLQIQSPSRVFFGFGTNIGEGTILGMQGRLAKVKQAAGQLASATLASASAAVAGAAPPARGAPAGGALTVHFAPVIHAANAAGVGEALRLSQAELERMLRKVLADQQRLSLAN
jgi:hypothetical protein